MPEIYAVTLMDRIDNLIAAGELNYHQDWRIRLRSLRSRSDQVRST